MIPWELLGREPAPGGGVLALYRRGGEFVIKVDGHDLMWSESRHSEEEMARLAIARLPRRPSPRVLVGGLGMGFTARAALDALPRGGSVVVAEIAPAVVAWNRGPLAHLARAPLADPRLRVEVVDVGRAIAEASEREPFDAILLDVDNGPAGLTRPANESLYGAAGLERARRALRPGGVLAVWSASPVSGFEQRLRRAGFVADTLRVRARGGGGGRAHSLFFGVAAEAAPTGQKPPATAKGARRPRR